MKEVDNTRQQYRRDFRAVYECEGCKATAKISGYDDEYFHMEVVPTIVCENCGESTHSLGLQAKDKTVVPEGIVI